MATVPYRYLEDLTGTSPNNRVVNDVYELRSKDVRAVAVRYGPFFLDTLVVYDDISNTPLIRDVDYSPVGLLPELTARTGKGIYDSILIVKKNMGNRVRLEYQVIGGPYINQAQTVADLSEAVLNDGRPIDWMTGVLGKQHEYTPSIHSHYLNDMVGWGPLVAAIDRLATSITIGQAPIFNFLYNKLNLIRATNEEIMEGTADNKFISPQGLAFAMQNMNFNAMYLTPYRKDARYGQVLEFKVTTNMPDAFTRMYWDIEHVTSNDLDFISLGGEFDMDLGEGSFSVPLVRYRSITEDHTFIVRVRRDTSEGPVMLKSLKISIPSNWEDADSGVNPTRMMNLFSSCCLFDVTNKDPIGMFFSEKDAG